MEGKLSSKVRGICYDNAGQIYIADTENNRVHIFTAEGDFQRAFGSARAGLLDSPAGIDFDANGPMYVSSKYGHDVGVFNADGDFVKKIGGQKELKDPRNIAVDEYGIVYVCDNNNDRICMY